MKVRLLTLVLAAVVVVTVSLVAAAPAFAYSEPGTGTIKTSCDYCHFRWVQSLGVIIFYERPPDGGDCQSCHADYVRGEFTGPHANYSATSRKCEACHTVHDAPSGLKLLPSATIAGTCRTCHDGTGGWGVYGAIKANTGLEPSGAHRTDATNTIPGGDAASGGAATRTFAGGGGLLTCTDCHSPHGAKVVAPFLGERSRTRGLYFASVTTRLLKRRPTGASAEAAQYGSDWCLGCHAGRSSAGPVHNHPADSTAVRADTFHYNNVAIAATDAPTANTVLAPLGGIPTTQSIHNAEWPTRPNASGNRGFVMPYPRTAQQAGHAPICQQCHEDSREAGDTLPSGEADAATATVAAGDGMKWNASSFPQTWTASVTDNPRFQNFPHETVNRRMLVETDDDLCTNCHPVALLP